MIAADPMVAPTKPLTVAIPSSPPVPRQSKTVKPRTNVTHVQATEPTLAETFPERTSQTSGASIDPGTDQPERVVDTSFGSNVTAEVPRDSEAAQAAAEQREQATREAREAELNKLVASGTYVVPISLDRAQSRTMLLASLFIVVLIIFIGGDAALDSGIIKITGIPHTHFIQK